MRRLAGKWVRQTHGVGGELWMPGTARKVNKRVLVRMKPEMSPGRAGAGLWGHREEAGFPGEGNTPGKPKAEKRGS